MRRSARPQEDVEKGNCSCRRLQVGRIASGSWVGGWFLSLRSALTQPPGCKRRRRMPRANSCSSTPGIKPLIRGLVDRGVAAAGRRSRRELDQRRLESTRTRRPRGLIAGPSDRSEAIADAQVVRRSAFESSRASQRRRGYCADRVGHRDKPIQRHARRPRATSGRRSTRRSTTISSPSLPAAYESVPNVAEFVVSRCALFYPEPFILGTSVASNDTNLLAAGYTEAA